MGKLRGAEGEKVDEFKYSGSTILIKGGHNRSDEAGGVKGKVYKQLC